MAHSTSMITAPVVMPTDIAEVLNISGTDLSDSCKSNAINMWARYKPEGAASGLQTMPIGQLSLAQRQLNGFGIRINYSNGYGSLNTLVTDLRAGTVANMFEYIKPSGGLSSPYRLTDFDGYYHAAHAPIWSPYTPNVVLDVSSQNTLQLYYYTNVNGSEQELGLKDLRIANDVNTFADYYFGILMWDGNSYYAATQDHVMGSSWQEGLDVTLQGVPQPSGSYTYTYHLIPFFATLPISSQSAAFYGTIIPMTFAQSDIKIGSASRWVSISVYAYVWSSDMGTLRVRWSCWNQTSAPFLFDTGGSSSRSWIEVADHEHEGIYGYWTVNISETIPAGTSRGGDIVVATDLLYGQRDAIREGFSYVQINAAGHTESYRYIGIVQVWDDSNP